MTEKTVAEKRVEIMEYFIKLILKHDFNQFDSSNLTDDECVAFADLFEFFDKERRIRDHLNKITTNVTTKRYTEHCNRCDGTGELMANFANGENDWIGCPFCK